MEYRDSSVTTGTLAVTLNPDHVHTCTWWIHPSFVDKSGREAAELIAFDILSPTLRSRARPVAESITLSQDCAFVGEMRTLFNSSPSGSVSFPNIETAMKKIKELESRLAKLESLADSQERNQ
jgi:hypothetical protein